MFKLKPEIKDRWVAALRSGNYVQGRSRLETITPEGSKHCCIGVLAKELGLKRKVKTLDSGTSYAFYDDSFLSLSNEAAQSVMAEGEFFSIEVQIGDNHTYLAEQNDQHSATFAQIADAIEAQL